MANKTAAMKLSDAKKLNRLNRFTTLPVLLDLLERKKLILLDPKTWDDKNDTAVILAYKERASIDNLFALCFTHDYETIHHWKTFANGASGCCIEFDASMLIEILDKTKGIVHGKVQYKKIVDAGKAATRLKKVPFTKRKPYECEQEYRVIWEGSTSDESFEIDISLEVIRKITFSQQMPRPVYETIKKLMKRMFDDQTKKIYRSTIYENPRWIKAFQGRENNLIAK